jgi:hypothetical protein
MLHDIAWRCRAVSAGTAPRKRPFSSIVHRLSSVVLLSSFVFRLSSFVFRQVWAGEKRKEKKERERGTINDKRWTMDENGRFRVTSDHKLTTANFH